MAVDVDAGGAEKDGGGPGRGGERGDEGAGAADTAFQDAALFGGGPAGVPDGLAGEVEDGVKAADEGGVEVAVEGVPGDAVGRVVAGRAGADEGDDGVAGGAAVGDEALAEEAGGAADQDAGHCGVGCRG